MTTYIAIDPGLSGAYAILAHGQTYFVRPMPKVEGRINWMAVAVALCDYRRDAMVAVEKVQAFGIPGASETTALVNYGRLLMLLEFHHMPYREIAPQTWVASYKKVEPVFVPTPRPSGLTNLQVSKIRQQDRKLSKARLQDIAARMFPSDRKYTSGESDALLLASYLRGLVTQASSEPSKVS